MYPVEPHGKRAGTAMTTTSYTRTQTHTKESQPHVTHSSIYVYACMYRCMYMYVYTYVRFLSSLSFTALVFMFAHAHTSGVGVYRACCSFVFCLHILFSLPIADISLGHSWHLSVGGGGGLQRKRGVGEFGASRGAVGAFAPSFAPAAFKAHPS